MELRTKTDEQYDEVLARIRSGAQKISDPLTDPEDRAKFMKVYDALVFEARAYRARCTVRDDPSMREEYERLGLIGKDEVL